MVIWLKPSVGFAVITLRCQYAFGVIHGHWVNPLHCSKKLTVIVALKQLNDGR